MCNINSFKKGDIVYAECKAYSPFDEEYDLTSKIIIVQSESEKYLFFYCIMECDMDNVLVCNDDVRVALRKEDYPIMRLATEKEKNRLFKTLAKKGLKFDCLNKK